MIRKIRLEIRVQQHPKYSSISGHCKLINKLAFQEPMFRGHDNNQTFVPNRALDKGNFVCRYFSSKCAIKL